jgi:hypothetical protein
LRKSEGERFLAAAAVCEHPDEDEDEDEDEV